MTIGSQSYYRFILDVNEVSGGGNEYVSLDSLKIYTSTTPNQSVAENLLGTLRYNMDAVGDNGVKLNYDLSPGSGQADMVVLIKKWDGGLSTDYVYLYSKFGALGVVTEDGEVRDYGVSDGFEEWAFIDVLAPDPPGGGVEPTPAPAGILLLASAIPVLGLRRIFRRKTA